MCGLDGDSMATFAVRGPFFISGALLKFFRAGWRSYATALKRNPVSTKTWTAVALLGGGDLVLQHLEREDAAEEIDGVRAMRSAAGGLLIGPLGHVGFRRLDKVALRLYPPPFRYDTRAWLFKLFVAHGGNITTNLAAQTVDSAVCDSTGISINQEEEPLYGKQQMPMSVAAAAGFKFVPVPYQCSFAILAHVLHKAGRQWYSTVWAGATQSCGVMVM